LICRAVPRTARQARLSLRTSDAPSRSLQGDLTMAATPISARSAAGVAPGPNGITSRSASARPATSSVAGGSARRTSRRTCSGSRCPPSREWKALSPPTAAASGGTFLKTETLPSDLHQRESLRARSCSTLIARSTRLTASIAGLGSTRSLPGERMRRTAPGRKRTSAPTSRGRVSLAL
jgi:hypothetical protein